MRTPPRPSRPPSAPTSRTWSRGRGGGRRPITEPRPASAPTGAVPAGLPAGARAVLAFWFGDDAARDVEARRKLWFRTDPAFDRTVGEHCRALHEDAAAGRLDDWAATPLGCLALVILLDQVPRNLFRGTPRAYASDAKARAVARAAIAAGHDRQLTPVQRWFVYLPFEHSEALEDQHLSLALFETLTDNPATAPTMTSVRRHLEIIERFGRFPHRNASLGRRSTAEEEAFLREPNSSF